MFWELLATLFAGFAGAGLALALNLMTGGRLPKATLPIMAGAAMLLAAISSEMTWFNRSVQQLPETVVVVRTNETTAFYRPWTYVWPMTNRFVAADIGGVQSNPAVPHQRIVDLYLLERWQPAQAFASGVDCERAAHVPMAVADIDEDGLITSESWEMLASDDALITAVCMDA